MEDRNINKITRSLINAVLEWTLILFLLLNSLFSFLIIKFSQYFALKPPCLWCSTLHRFLEPQNINSHRDLLCESHSKEVSSLGFCPNHKKLAEIKGLCEDCFSSHLGFQSEVKQSDGDEQKLRCSCCGLKFRKKNVDDSLLNRSCWDVLEYTKNGDLIMGIERKIGSNDQIGSDLVKENLEVDSRKENRVNFDGKDVLDSNSFEIEKRLNQIEKGEDSSSDLLSKDLEFFFDYSGSQLVPIELVDSSTEESQNVSEADEDHEFRNQQKSRNAGLQSLELEEIENFHVFNSEIVEFINQKSSIVKETQALFVEEHEENAAETGKFDPNTHSVHEDAYKVSIGTWIPVLDSCVKESLTNSHENGEDFKLNGNHSEVEEEKIPETPTSISSLDQLHKKLLAIERKESGAEESFDGSVMSEMDCGDPITTVEKLKSALKAERKALHALYAELEVERGASAVAAIETMAMINRLQEEKAAMQMEALHYQRMMEEQSEYDQEALQLLNNLMIKREKELESYRKKVVDYEAKERMRFSNSVSCSHSEDGDKMLTETNDEINGNRENWHETVPDDSISGFLNPESSLTDFEKERLSILEQLKVLEVKLFTLSDEEDPHFVDVRPIEDFYDENGELSRNGLQTISSAEKTLVDPLFDEIGIEVEDKVMESNGFHFDELENGKRRVEIEDEIDQVYERLHALEADREFLKHCVGSLKKGDKGMELLQEILQHLRDLRTMDIHHE